MATHSDVQDQLNDFFNNDDKSEDIFIDTNTNLLLIMLLHNLLTNFEHFRFTLNGKSHQTLFPLQPLDLKSLRNSTQGHDERYVCKQTP